MSEGDLEPTNPPIDRASVAYVARLARLSLSEPELEMFTGQLASILGHVADIAGLELDELAPMSHPLPATNVFRPDVPRPCLDPGVALSQAPQVEDDRFMVPRIVGEAP